MNAVSSALAQCTEPRPRSALLIDADAAQLELGKLRLCDEGFEVRTASSVREALALLETQLSVPDVILSDVVIDEIDGFGLCRILRREPALARVPVILISSHHDSSDQERAVRVGANALVRRTADFGAELAALRQNLRVEPAHGASERSAEAYEEHLRATTDQLAKMLEQARSAEDRYRTLFNNARDTVTLIGMDGFIVEANTRWETMLGIPAQTMIGKHITMFAPPGEDDVHTQSFLTQVEARGGRTEPVPLQHPDGSVVYLEFSASVIEIEGRPLLLAIGRDVTAQVIATRQKSAAEEKYRSLVERLPDVIWTCRQDGVFTFVTPNATQILGYTPEEICAEDTVERVRHIHPEDLSTVRSAFVEFIEKATPFDLEYRRQHKQGHWIWIRNRTTSSYVRDGARFTEGMITDVTERKRLEDSLRHAQKMEAVGQLSGGIAHDFNNILAAILANCDFLLENLSPRDSRRSDAEEIRLGAQKAAALTRQLLAFSRRQVLAPTVVDLNGVVSGIEKMLCRLIGEDIELSVQSDPDLGTVRVDAGQLEQVIMNLVVNARDAMPNGGNVSIDTANVDLNDPASAEQVGVAPGRYVVVTVSDTGTGMDIETQRRMFEPFFTTKEVGRGTGLGLATCYGIIKQSGGAIRFHSEPGRGSVFRVYLPRIDSQLGAPRRNHATPDLHGSETILIVEDELTVRKAVTRMLAPLGYRVLSAGCGAEAVKLVAEHEGTIDLVLSDMVLPGSNGPEIVDQLRARCPNARAIFMSGYTDHAILRSGALQPGTHFLQKPFSRATLVTKIREVLVTPSAGS